MFNSSSSVKSNKIVLGGGLEITSISLRVNEVKRFVYNRADIYKKFNLLDDYRKEEITCILDEQVNWVIENEPQEHKYALKALYWVL
jgi:hypothetical protein